MGPVLVVVGHLLATPTVGAVLDRCAPPLSSRWFVVRPWEPVLWRRVGVGTFATGLRLTGWHRVVRRRRGFDGTRSGLAALDRHTRGSELCHLVVGAAGSVAVGIALLRRDAPGALWLGGANVVFHVYPVLLQRTVRARISRIRGVAAVAPDRVTGSDPDR